MLLHVLHETAYDYAPPVKTAQHMAHLKPAHNGSQTDPETVTEIQFPVEKG